MPISGTKLFLDFETKSEVDIAKCGAYKYVEGDEFDVLLLAYAFDDQPVKVIDFTDDRDWPEDFLAGLRSPEVTCIAHNCAFERAVIHRMLGYTEPEKWFDTMFLTASCGLPLSLDGACSAIGMPEDKAKLKSGKALIREFCSPQKKPLKKWDYAEWITPGMDPENWELFKEYCARDVDAMRTLFHSLERWIPDDAERRIWALDTRINERGMKSDRVFVTHALEMDAKYKAELTEAAIAVSGLENPSSVAQIKDWLQEQEDLEVPSLNKKEVADLVGKLQTDKAKEFMAIRSELSKTSTKKYDAFIRCACKDDHVKGCFQIFGGHTGRWCLTADHEVLTPKGWQKIGEWPGGPIAVWSPQNAALSFQTADAVCFPYSGDLIQLDSARCQQLSTPDHKMMTRAKNGLFTPKTVGELYGRRFTVPLTGLRSRGYSNMSNDELRVLIMVQADGHYTEGGDLRLAFKRPRKVDRCKQLLRRVGITHAVTQHPDRVLFTIKRRHQPLWLRQFRDKTFGWWLLDEDPQTIIEELEHWDGTRCGPNSIQYTTTNKQNADVIQAVCQLSGLVSTMITKDRRDEHPDWSVAYILNIWLTPGETTEIRAEQQSKVPFDGLVYCAVTPTGYFLVRRNGVAWITGNSGRLVQLQNLPQNRMSDLAEARALVKTGDYEVFKMLYPAVTPTLSELIRTALIAEEGQRFVVSDFSAIEARVSAWFANEEWRLKVFREGGDIYCASASQMFKVPVVKGGINGDLRQKGKVAELALGYGGGVNALKAFGADKMGMSNEEMAQTVDQWRTASPNICAIWSSLDYAMKRCIVHRATTVDKVGGVRFRWDNGIVWMRLPSGREMAYYHPEYGESRYTKGKMTISYMGVGQKTRKWERIETWGGRIFENLVQATARDCLRDTMLRLDEAGWDIRGHVHDEIICSEPYGGKTVDDMCAVFAEPITWAPGLPLTGAGYETPFYMKD